jgi:hypothetical protein
MSDDLSISPPVSGVSASDLPRGREALARLVAEAVAAEQASAFEGHSEALLLWLALSPTWPREYLEKGVPGPSGMLTGSAALDAVGRAVKAGLASGGRSEADPNGSFYWMTQPQSASVLSYVALQPKGVSLIFGELTNAARAMRRAADKLPEKLERWCRLGEAGPLEENIAAVLDEEIDAAINDAVSRNAVVCPEGRRWIETATPISARSNGAMRVSLLRAKRRFELFHRDANDRRHLTNFLPRSRQLKAFDDLMNGSDDSWALHYVGGGGAGKTMLVRHITAVLARERKLPAARIDFDFLNPEYPTRAPALLLAAFAEELRRYERPGTSGFDYFYSAAATVQESVTARGAGVDEAVVLAAVAPALRAFVDALRQLGTAPLLILDTCEELAKLQPDGEIPANVRMTLAILERIHQELPKLRVIFSGRRPLASEGHGWTSPVSKLPPRSYLRLFVVGGFSHTEATDLLGRFREEDCPVGPELFDPILEASRFSDSTFTGKFRYDAGEPAAAECYNPFDLSACASLAAHGRFSPGAGRHAYVRERIIERIPALLGPLLPAIVRLGSFDRELLEALREGLPVDAGTLADEAGQQHWIGEGLPQDGEPRWVVDRLHRRRLLDYYIDEDNGALSQSDARLARVLPPLTLKRPWARLDIDLFDATLQVLQHDVAAALDWWEQVEERIARDAQWDWGQRMTATLLATESGSRDEAERKVPDRLLRASIMATHAAALGRMGRTDQSSAWRYVLETLTEVEGSRADFLRRRAYAAQINELQWSPLPVPEILSRLILLLDARPVAPIGRRAELVTEVALLEGAVEVLERAASGWTDLSAEIGEVIGFIRRQKYVYATSSLGLVEQFSASLLARIAVLEGDRIEAERLFRRSLGEVWGSAKTPLVFDWAAGTTEEPIPSWLDWTPPVNLVARLGLEAVRGLSLRFDVRILEFPPRLPPGDTLDSDRLVSAIRIAIGASDPGDARLKVKETPPIRTPWDAAELGACNAHRWIPSAYSTGLEQVAAKGDPDRALRFCRAAMQEAERAATVLEQNDLARLHARLVCDYRLYDAEETLSRIILDSKGVAESELALRYFTLTGLDWGLNEALSLRFFAVLGTEWDPETSGDRAAYDDRAVYLRSRIDFRVASDSRPRPVSDAGSEIAVHSGSRFIDVWRTLAGINLTSPSSPERDRAIDWLSHTQRDPLAAIRLLVRIFNQPGVPGDCRPLLGDLAQHAGRIRAAEIVIEESELATFQGQLQTTQLLEHAAGWFLDAGLSLGALRARVLASMARPASMTRGAILETLPDGFPKAEAVLLALGSTRHVDVLTQAIDTTAPTIRPWVLRAVAACFALDRESQSRGAQQRFEKWLATQPLRGDLALLSRAQHAAETDAPIRELVNELLKYGLLVGGASYLLSLLWTGVGRLSASPLATSLVRAIGISLFFALVGGLRKKTARKVIFGLLIVGGAWLGLYVGLAAIPMMTIFGPPGSFSSILSFNLAIGLVVYFAAQRKRWVGARDFLRMSTASRLLFQPGNKQMALRSPFGNLSAPVDYGEISFYSGYVLLRNSAAEETATLLDKWLAAAWLKPLPVEIALENEDAARICWEAMVDPSLFREDRRTGRVKMHRSFPTPKQPRRLRRPSRIDVVGSSSHDAWLAVGSTHLTYLVSSALSEIVVRGPTEAVMMSGPEILHLIGIPTLVRDELRLDLGGVSEHTRGMLLDAAFFRRPDWSSSCCIVQGRPNDSSIRTDTDRDVAGRLRQFGAQVFTHGVAIVLVIPPLPTALSRSVIESIAAALIGGKLRSREAWLDLCESLRQTVLNSARGENPSAAEVGFVALEHLETAAWNALGPAPNLDFEATVELAYDLCIYMTEKVPDLRPAWRWFGWFRP